MTIFKNEVNEQQGIFDRDYVTVGELCETYGVTRSSIKFARETGKLPNAIAVGNQYIWHRETIEPHLDAWVLSVMGRRNG